MIGGAEKISSSSEAVQTGTEKHPLEDMSSFEEHMRQMESAKAGQLRNLQAGLEQAKADNDEVAIEGYENAIRGISGEQESNSSANSSEKLEQDKPQFEAVPFAEIAKDLEDPRYEELGHGTVSAENAQSILNEGLRVGGPGRDTDIDSNFMPLANNDSNALLNSAENWQHNDAKFIVLYRIPFEYKLPTANMHGSETYKMFYEPNDGDPDAKSGKYSKDFAYAFLDVNTGMAYKNNAYKGDLDNPEQKAEMENKYQLLRNETASKITDPEEREGFLAMAESWHEMGESMMPKQPEQAQPQLNPEKEEQIESAAEDIDVAAERESGRTKIASGDVSSIYSIEKTDGKTSTVVESQYFDMAEKFASAHDELKNDFDLRLAMSGMSTDLALIDATHGRNFTNGSEKTRTSLLEDYSTLRARLDNPDTSPEEKQLISDYFDTMSGNALSFLESRYNPDLAKKDATEEQKSDEAKEKINRVLADTKEEVEKIKKAFSEDSSQFDSALAHINELVDGRSTDLDELQSSLTKLLQAQESLAQSTGRFNKINGDYLTDIVQNEERLGEDSYRKEFSNVEYNNEQVQGASRKVQNVDDRIAQIKTYIHRVEDLINVARRF